MKQYLKELQASKKKEILSVKNFINNQEYKAIFENSPDTIVLMDTNGHITDVNRKVCYWLGYRPEEIKGKNFRNLSFLPLKSKLVIASSLFKKANNRFNIPDELEFIDIEGKTKTGKISVSTINDQNGKTSHILVIISDITREKEIEQGFQDKQNQLKAIFQVSTDVLAIMDSSYTYKLANPAFCEYMGLREKEIIGKTDFDLYPEEEARRYRKSDMEVLDSGDKWEEECPAINREGEEKWFHVIKSPILDHAKITTGILITIRDITDRKLAEKKVIQQKDFLDKMFESSANGLILVNQSKKIVRINNSALKIFGEERDKMINRRACSLFNCPSIGEPCKKIIEDTNIISAECKAFSKNGNKETPVLKSIIKIEDNNEIFLLESFMDITERKRLEDELIYHKNNLEEIVLERTREIEETNAKLLIAKNKAEESDKLKSAFLANMSHEIRTPMNIILGFTELLNFEDSTQTKLEYTQNIQKSVNDLLELINDIIDLSQIEAGSKKPRYSKFPIDGKLRNLHETFMSYEKIRNGKIKFVLDDNLQNINEEIVTDPRIFKQVMVNLIDNAIKFTDEGSVSFGYHLVEKNGGPYYQFYVSDTGIGIAHPNEEIIFDRFRQVDYSNKRVYGGTGLGLTICKANIDLLGGKIWVDSKIGKGSTFYFSIPANNK